MSCHSRQAAEQYSRLSNDDMPQDSQQTINTVVLSSRRRHSVQTAANTSCQLLPQLRHFRPARLCTPYTVCLSVSVIIMSEKRADSVCQFADRLRGWLGSRVVSVLDSGAVGPGFKSAVATLSGNSLRQTVHTHCASVYQAAKLVATLLRVAGAGVTVGLAESNGSLPLGLRLTSPAG